MQSVTAILQKIYRTLASVRTGIILLLVVVLFSAVGTVILQRPTSEPDVVERSYSPSTLLWLDRLGLTDIYHTWYFVTLLGLVSISIILVSIDRWPNTWKFYSKPYRVPAAGFRATLPQRAEIPVSDAAAGLSAAERAFYKMGLPVDREVEGDQVSLFSERNRISEFAVYFVHASLLFLLFGYILDLQVGYRGTLALNEGDTSNVITERIGNREVTRTLPFSVRCDSASVEDYLDKDGRDTGMPRKYWSKLVVVENGRDVRSKEIIVNDPLTYRGLRFYQSGMDQGSKVRSVDVEVTAPGATEAQKATLALGKEVSVGDATVSLKRFVPDYYQQDGEIYTKSETPNNPALLFVVKKAGAEYPVWVFASESRSARDAKSGFTLNLLRGSMATLTVLQVSYQPGQWLIFPGVLLMVTGLVMVLLMSHSRYWAIVVPDAKNNPVLWVGGATNRNRERFEQRFQEVVRAIRAEFLAAENNKTEVEVHEPAHV